MELEQLTEYEKEIAKEAYGNLWEIARPKLATEEITDLKETRLKVTFYGESRLYVGELWNGKKFNLQDLFNKG